MECEALKEAANSLVTHHLYFLPQERSRCLYQNMVYLDESQNNLLPRFHFEFLVQEAEYPVLGEGIYN